jgi:hypothetical protein
VAVAVDSEGSLYIGCSPLETDWQGGVSHWVLTGFALFGEFFPRDYTGVCVG